MVDARRGRTQASRIIWAQLALTAVISATFAVFAGLSAGLAAVAGGMINVVANWYFIRRWFVTHKQEDGAPAAGVMRFFVAEAAKVLVTILLLALAIGVFKLAFIPLFVAFVATLLVFLFALSARFWSLFGDRL